MTRSYKIKNQIITLFAVIFPAFLSAQENVGIGVPAPQHRLHVEVNTGNFGSRAIYGVNQHSGTTSQQWGVFGEIKSTATANAGAGVIGMATGVGTTSAGVRGETGSALGRGVFGWAYSATGTNYGIYGLTNSQDGYAGYFSGGRNYFSGNIGAGVLSPIRALHVAGSETLGSIIISGNSESIDNHAELIFSENRTYTYGMYFYYDGVGNKLQVFGKSLSNIYGPHVTILRNSGNMGLGIDNPTRKLHVYTTGAGGTTLFEGSGAGLNNATVRAFNSGGGVAGFFDATSADASLVVRQNNASGSLIKAFGANGGNHEMILYNDGSMEFFNGSHIRTIRIDPSESGTTDAGQITLYNSTGSTATIEIDGSFNGVGRVTTNELQITGGSDITEPFSVAFFEDMKAGMVLSIDDENHGELKVSSEPYDRCVAGIISGAGGVRPGLIMGQKGTIADGDVPVALSGRVYCWCDASHGAIKPGDLLTTSYTPGHAMKATDMSRAPGAVIGKAMTSLNEGQGLVLVLVSLQ